MIELKAELMKKRKEYEESKKNRSNPSKPTVPKAQIKSASVIASVDEDVLKRSREALEVKARLYSKLEKGKMMESDLKPGQRDNLMVDFAFKGWNPETEEFEFRDSGSDSESEDSYDSVKGKVLGIDQVLKMIQDDDDDQDDDRWIEYEDEFGRFRVSKLSQLRQIQKERQEINLLHQSTSTDTTAHYDGDAEIRNKGVAFYQFSRNSEEERQRQMGQLRKLREETMERRLRVMLMKEQRRLLIENRLNKRRRT